jgi:hypothetical protein
MDRRLVKSCGLDELVHQRHLLIELFGRQRVEVGAGRSSGWS